MPYAGALWVIRVVLLASVLVHIYAAVRLWIRASRVTGGRGGRRYASRRDGDQVEHHQGAGPEPVGAMVGEVGLSEPTRRSPCGGHDCREGICGMCGLVINGIAHGPESAVTTCQLHMRRFTDGAVIDVEPWRAAPFPIIKDLVVDRGAFDRIIQTGGYISAPAGAAPDAHTVPVPRTDADHAFDAATCIGCGACVAACPNGSAMLFAGAKISHLGRLPQGQPERASCALRMISQHDAEGFGACTQIGECTAVCRKEIQLDVISRFDRDVLGALSHGDG